MEILLMAIKFIGLSILLSAIVMLLGFTFEYIKYNIWEPYYYDKITYRFVESNPNWLHSTNEPKYLPVSFNHKGSVIETFVSYDAKYEKTENIPSYIPTPELRILYINKVPVYCIYKIKNKKHIYWNNEYSVKEIKSIIKSGNKAYNKRLNDKVKESIKKDTKKSLIYKSIDTDH